MQPPNQENTTSISKMLLAIALTILCLSIYSYFFPQEKKESKTTQALPQDNQVAQAPVQNTSMQSISKTEVLTIVKSKDFDIEIDTLGRIAQVYLKDKKFITPPQENLLSKLFSKKKNATLSDRLPLFDTQSIRPLEVRFSDTALNELAFKNAYQTSSKEVILDKEPIQIELVQTLGKESFKKILTINPDLSYKIELIASNPSMQYFITNGARPVAENDTYVFLGTIVQKDGGTLERFEKDDVEGVENFKDSTFVASVDRYFASILFDKGGKKLDVLVDGNIKAQSPIAFVSLQGNGSVDGYIGAKNYQELKALYPPLTDVVEYGLITFFAKPLFLLLEVLYNFIGNWGWAIVLLTILVRVALFPLSYKGMLGMQKLKDLAPQMKQIQAQYKDDPQKMQKHIMELYKKNGANPLGGCLPLLLQIPVFFAIYKVLYCAVELKAEPWILWIHDLSVIDPYYILPLIMGITMYVSQIMTPTTYTDPMQEKVFKLLPLFFTIFFIIFPFPAGLVLYWSVNNLFSIAQQMLINRIVAKQKETKQ